jgi:echinoid protein
VDHEPELGRYDLRIKSATYDRDNGAFECRKVESGSGRKLHSSTIDLVVLLPPSPPTLSPVNPTVTEGKPFNLSCATIGGSPPPEILWYRIGGGDDGGDSSANDEEAEAAGGNNRRRRRRQKEEEQVEEGISYLPAVNRHKPTTSVLTVVPRKEDDGSEYRCTVWNRAIAESDLMEASTSIEVNCK